jgi:hypothetical protein
MVSAKFNSVGAILKSESFDEGENSPAKKNA